MGQEIRSETDAARSLVEAYHKPEIIKVPRGTSEEATVLLAPSGMQVRDVDEFLESRLENPRRREQTARLDDVDSFIAHIERYKGPTSTVFVDKLGEAPKVVAVYDDHAPQDGKAGWGEDVATYAFPISKPWQAWVTKRPQSLTQAQFAGWIEKNLGDVASPANAGPKAKEFGELFGVEFASPSKLLELSRGISLHVNERVTQAVNLSTGEVQLNYESQHQDKAGAQIKVPGAFLLAIPVFERGVLYQLPVRLRYAHGGGQVTWSFEVHRSDAAYDDAVAEAVKRIGEETKLPVFHGVR